MFTLPSVYSYSSPLGLLILKSIIFTFTQEDLQTFVWCSLLEANTDTRRWLDNCFSSKSELQVFISITLLINARWQHHF